MRKYAAEFLGTFVLVFCGCGAVVVNDVTRGGVTLIGIGITFGLVVMAVIYAIGDISGAHINPSVTIGFYLSRRFPGRCVLPYVASQIAGALAASLALRLMFTNRASLGATLPLGSIWQSFWLEVALTAILMFVILCVSTGPKEMGIMAGIAIGGVITFEVFFGGPISGASMNPARSIAPALVSGNLTALWAYIAGPILGAAIAVPCWRVIRGPMSAAPAQASQPVEVISVS